MKRDKEKELALVGRTLAAVQRLADILETRKCDRLAALTELEASTTVDPRIARAMAAVFASTAVIGAR